MLIAGTTGSGKSVCVNEMYSITNKLHLLQTFENAFISVREVYSIDTDYRCIYAMHNYIFYRVDVNYIYIVNIYNEKEDFMLKLFGIRNIS